MMEIDVQCVQCSIDKHKTRKYTCTTDRTFLGDDFRSKLCCSGNSEGVRVSNTNRITRDDHNGYAGSVVPVTHQQQETMIHSNNENLAQTNHLIEQKQQLLLTRKQLTDINKSSWTRHAKFRSYSKFDIREQSFIGWTSASTFPIWMFAKAGFFYKGKYTFYLFKIYITITTCIFRADCEATIYQFINCVVGNCFAVNYLM